MTKKKRADDDSSTVSNEKSTSGSGMKYAFAPKNNRVDKMQKRLFMLHKLTAEARAKVFAASAR